MFVGSMQRVKSIWIGGASFALGTRTVMAPVMPKLGIKLSTFIPIAKPKRRMVRRSLIPNGSSQVPSQSKDIVTVPVKVNCG